MSVYNVREWNNVSAFVLLLEQCMFDANISYI